MEFKYKSGQVYVHERTRTRAVNELYERYNNLSRAVDLVYDTAQSETVKNLASCWINNQNHLAPAVSIDDIRRISYARNVDDILNNDKRVKTTIGRYITRQLPDVASKFSESDIATFCNYLVAEINGLSNKEDDVFLDLGYNVSDAYSGNLYIGERGSLGGSCMRHEHCQEYFDIYYELDCKTLILWDSKNKQKILGRAIVWDNVIFDNDALKDCSKLLDRVYIADYCHEFLFTKWAKDNGYVYKAEQSYSAKTKFVYKGETYSCGARVDIDYSILEKFPYIDTFTYGYGTYISNIIGNEALDIFEGLEGEKYKIQRSRCDECGEMVDDNGIHALRNIDGSAEAYHRVCRSCYGISSITYCNCCENTYANTPNNFPEGGEVCGTCIINNREWYSMLLADSYEISNLFFNNGGRAIHSMPKHINENREDHAHRRDILNLVVERSIKYSRLTKPQLREMLMEPIAYWRESTRNRVLQLCREDGCVSEYGYRTVRTFFGLPRRENTGELPQAVFDSSPMSNRAPIHIEMFEEEVNGMPHVDLNRIADRMEAINPEWSASMRREIHGADDSEPVLMCIDTYRC